MKKILIDNTLYSVVEVEFFDGDKKKGWIVPYGNGYQILPLQPMERIDFFRSSHVKSIRLKNGYTLTDKDAKYLERGKKV